MNSRATSTVWRLLSQIRPSLIALVVFVLLLGLINWLLVGQHLILYLFYVPVVIGAWFLPKRHAVGVALLAAGLVVNYALYIPGKLAAPAAGAMLWADLGIWGGILVVTAYLVATLRAWTEEAMRNLHRAYRGVLSILTKFIQTVDADTEAHSVRVSAWGVHIAQAMGLERSAVEEVRIAGLLHDVGKVEISVDIIRRAAALSKEDKSLIQAHPASGAALVKPVGGMLASIADAIESHHEKVDGSGYNGLRGEQIPLTARILAVADAFDAMISDRPYRKGTGVFEALDEIAAGTSTHFDPRVAAALKKVVHENGEHAVSLVASEAYD